MKIEINLEYIQKMGTEREDENLAFRAYLKQHDMHPDDIDAYVHEITDEVSSKIDCTICANCCKQVRPVLDDNDISRFTIGLNISESEFREQYLSPDEDSQSKFRFKELPCPFLKNDQCTNYDNRPTDCRSYPHLEKDGFIYRLWSVIDNYEICPIVFNVYEQLKTELWHDDLHEDDFSWV
jgi:Fe-S-cluster containining protein